MSLKCILINPIELTHPSYGLLHIASALEQKGHCVEIREIPSAILVPFSRSLGELIEYLKRADADLIGITCMATQADKVRSIVSKIKENSEIEGKIVLGGVHPSFVPEEVMGWGADYVVVNEGEETIVELAMAVEGKMPLCDVKGIYYREEGKVCHSAPRPVTEDLDTLALPAYHLLDKERFSTRNAAIRGLWLSNALVYTSRGCPSTCTYCSAHKMFGKRVRYKSLDKIFGEIDYALTRFGNRSLYIMDDTFTVSKARVIDFCSRMKKNYPGIVWGCQAKINLFDEEMARAMKAGGCIQLDFGVESGSQRILDRLKKGIRIEQTIRAFDICRKVSLRTFATVMVGSPDEDPEDLECTRRLLERIAPDFVVAYFTTPFPGTELYEEAISRGILSEEMMKREHLLDGVLPWTKASIQDIQKAQKEFMKFNPLKHYLFNPLFHYDMLRFAVRNPRIVAKIISNAAKGNTKEAFYIVTALNYRKRF